MTENGKISRLISISLTFIYIFTISRWLEVKSFYEEKTKKLQVNSFVNIKFNNQSVPSSQLFKISIDILFNDKKCPKQLNSCKKVKSNKIFKPFPSFLLKKKRRINLVGYLTIKIKRKVFQPLKIENEINENWNLSRKFIKSSEKDCCFVIQNRLFKFHREILKQQSELFNQLLNNDEKSVIFISDIKPEVFKTLLLFFYGELEKFEENFQKLNFAICRSAWSLRIPSLKVYCTNFMLQYCTHHERVFHTYLFATNYEIEDLKEYCWEIIRL